MKLILRYSNTRENGSEVSLAPELALNEAFDLESFRQAFVFTPELRGAALVFKCDSAAQTVNSVVSQISNVSDHRGYTLDVAADFDESVQRVYSSKKETVERVAHEYPTLGSIDQLLLSYFPEFYDFNLWPETLKRLNQKKQEAKESGPVLYPRLPSSRSRRPSEVVTQTLVGNAQPQFCFASASECKAGAIPVIVLNVPMVSPFAEGDTAAEFKKRFLKNFGYELSSHQVLGVFDSDVLKNKDVLKIKRAQARKLKKRVTEASNSGEIVQAVIDAVSVTTVARLQNGLGPSRFENAITDVITAFQEVPGADAFKSDFEKILSAVNVGTYPGLAARAMRDITQIDSNSRQSSSYLGQASFCQEPSAPSFDPSSETKFLPDNQFQSAQSLPTQFQPTLNVIVNESESQLVGRLQQAFDIKFSYQPEAKVVVGADEKGLAGVLNAQINLLRSRIEHARTINDVIAAIEHSVAEIAAAREESGALPADFGAAIKKVAENYLKILIHRLSNIEYEMISGRLNKIIEIVSRKPAQQITVTPLLRSSAAFHQPHLQVQQPRVVATQDNYVKAVAQSFLPRSYYNSVSLQDVYLQYQPPPPRPADNPFEIAYRWFLSTMH